MGDEVAEAAAVPLPELQQDALHRQEDPPDNGEPPDAYTTPKLGSNDDEGRFGHVVYDEDDLATPTFRSVITASGDGGHEESPPPAGPAAKEKTLTRPGAASLRLRTLSSKSLQLHELAAMHDPSPSSAVFVGDDRNEFERLELTTPTFEKFNLGDTVPWERRTSDDETREAPLQDSRGSGTPRRRKNGPSSQRRSKSASGHHRKSSSLTMSSRPTSPDRARRNRHSAYFPSGDRPPELASYFIPTVTADPESYAQSVRSRPFRSESVSSSASSVADSAGTAAEATDSEYEERRLESRSRTSSRMPSRKSSATEIVAPNIKRLSSFSPIPALLHSASSANVKDSSTSNTPSHSPPLPRDAVVVPSTKSARPSLDGQAQASRRASSDKVGTAAGSSVGPSGHHMEKSLSNASDQSARSNTSTSSHDPSEGSSVGTRSQPMSPDASADGATAMNGIATTAAILSTPGSGVGVTVPKELRPKKSSKSGKVTALQKALSKTRQKDLPPKPEKEDEKHLKQYRDMLVAAKAAEKHKKELEAGRKQARDNLAAASLPVWEKNILQNWKATLRDEKLRAVWWNGSMPPRHRARLWQGCIGNGLALGKGSYTKALALAKSLQAAGRFPASVEEALEADIALTFAQTKLFQQGCPLHDDVRDMLLAHSVFWQNATPAYAQGTSYIAAMLLISMPPQDAFLSMVNLVDKSLLKTFYRGPQEDIEAYYRVFNTLLADKMPKIYRNFVSHDIRPQLYLRPWLTSLYSRYIGFETATRIWDVYVLEGDQFLFRLALALLQILEARLFNPDHEELAELFRGEDRGARAIVARDNRKVESLVEPWEVYELLGANEDAIFDTIKNMEWKEATFHRLLTRELPDADA